MSDPADEYERYLARQDLNSIPAEDDVESREWALQAEAERYAEQWSAWAEDTFQSLGEP